MSDTENPAFETEQTTEESPHGEDIDWKAQSRKWEKLAKQNKDAADELAALKASQMTEQEKLQERVEKAEALVRQYEEAEQHRTDAADVSKKTGVPVSLLMHCGTRDDMEQFAGEYAKETRVPSAPPAPNTRIVRPNNSGGTNAREMFQQFMESNF